MTSNKYLSKYSNGKSVSAAQYITEMICEKKAKKDKLDLHYRFWLNKEWSSFYKNQISSAHKLLDKYDEMAIIKALSSSKTNNIYSLRYPGLEAIIKNEEEKLRIQSEKVATKNINYDRTHKVGTRQQFKQNKSIISKLEELDDECN
jgi:hypothetical protein